VENTKKRRRGKKTEITAALIANIATAIKSGHRRTIRHIALVLGVLLKTSFTQYLSKIQGPKKCWQNWSPNDGYQIT
jgi:hypothetical protein